MPSFLFCVICEPEGVLDEFSPDRHSLGIGVELGRAGVPSRGGGVFVKDLRAAPGIVDAEGHFVLIDQPAPESLADGQIAESFFPFNILCSIFF